MLWSQKVFLNGNGWFHGCQTPKAMAYIAERLACMAITALILVLWTLVWVPTVQAIPSVYPPTHWKASSFIFGAFTNADTAISWPATVVSARDCASRADRHLDLFSKLPQISADAGDDYCLNGTCTPFFENTLNRVTHMEIMGSPPPEIKTGAVAGNFGEVVDCTGTSCVPGGTATVAESLPSVLQTVRSPDKQRRELCSRTLSSQTSLQPWRISQIF